MNRRRLLLFADLLILAGAFFGVALLRETSDLGLFRGVASMRGTLGDWGMTFAVLAFLKVAVSYLFGLYDGGVRFDFGATVFRSFAASSILLGLLVLSFYLTNPFQVPRSIPVLVTSIDFFAVTLLRILVRLLSRNAVRRLLLLGTNESSLRLLKELRLHGHRSIHVIGVLREGGGEPSPGEQFYIHPVLGSCEVALEVIRREKPDLVFLALESIEAKARVTAALPPEHLHQIEVFSLPGAYEILIGRPSYLRIGDIPLIRIPKSLSRAYGLKRVVDLLGASVAMILLAPLFFLLSLLVKVSSPGPVFFRQERVGRWGEIFRIAKFRTLRHDPGAVISPVKGKDPRLTRVGRFLRTTRLDELPQLWNIFVGEMSFIGPRPLVKKEVDAFRQAVPGFDERFVARPGISGLAQVHGDYYTQPEDKLKYDLWYCYHFDWAMEAGIFFRTLKTVVLRKGT